MKKTRSGILIALATLLLAVVVAFGVTYAVKNKDDMSAEASTYSVSSYSTLSSYVSSYSTTSSSSQNTLKLTANLTATSTITISSGYYITIDLNGYNIALGSSTTKAFNVYGTLTIKDSAESYTKSTKQSSLGSDSLSSSSNKYTKTFYVTETNGTYTKYTYKAGSIYGSSASSTYGTICVYNGGTLNMYGGIIHSNSNSYGAGIYLNGSSSSTATFNMYGGIICDNSATYAGAIYSSYGTMNFIGGAIADNSVSEDGSAVCTKTDTVNSYRFGLNGESSTGSKFDRMIVCGNSAKYGTVVSFSSTAGVPFYMYDGAIFSGNTVTNSGAVVYSRGNIYFYGGEVTGNKASFGNFFVEDGYSMTMSGGTVAYNTEVARGDLIYGHGDNSITISGGTVENNSCTYGAVGYLKTGCSVKMTGGTIQNNTSSDSGGAFYMLGSTVTISGGTITNNTSSKYGGVAALKEGSTFSATSGTVTNNTASTRGGALYLDTSSDSVSITGGTWTGNSCDGSGSYGGMIYNNGGSVTLSGITISGCSAAYGGAIYTTGDLTLKKTTIQSNNATSKYGGGIYLYKGSLTISGKVIIQDNYVKSTTLQNVYIASGIYITLGGSLSSGSDIGVTLASSSQTQITTEESSTSYYSSATQYFSLDEGGDTYFITSRTGKYVERMEMAGNVSVMVTMQGSTSSTYYDSLGDAVAAAVTKSASTYGTVTLLEDVGVSSTITIEEGYYVKLDLNGCTASWTGDSKTDFFLVYGYMALTDSTASGGIYGGGYSGADGGGVYAVTSVSSYTNGDATAYRTDYPVMDDEGGTFYCYYESGAITGGLSNYGASNSDTNSRGGAICVGSSGTFEMYGGTVCGNTATYGGGVMTYGTFTMYGGSISANTAVNTSTKHNGGGLFVESTSVTALYGGVIYGNEGSGKGYGGGIENLGTLVLGKLSSSESGASYDFAGLGIVVSSNSTDNYGGAIYGTGTIAMSDGYLTLNTALGADGGAVYSTGAFAVSGGHITGNTSASSGGGVYVAGTFTLTGGTIAFNGAGANGGGVYAAAAAEISGGIVSNNHAGSEGGGFYGGGKTTVSGGTFSYNTAETNSGGGLSLYGNTAISDAVVTHNATGGTNYGGGINVGGGATLTVDGGYIAYNQSYRGAGVHIGSKGTTFILNDGYICYNEASDRGGGIYLGDSGTVFYMYGGLVSYNVAGGYGGGIFVNTSSTDYFYGGEISQNVTLACGGGVYVNTSVNITIGGDAVVYDNAAYDSTAGSCAADNVYLPSGKVVEIENDFEGKIGILTAASPTVRISASAFSQDEFVALRDACEIVADSELVLCIGLNSSGYISFFPSHAGNLTVYQDDETGKIIAVEYCSQCFINMLSEDGGGDEISLKYFVGEDGVVYVTATDGDGNEATIALDGGVTVEDAQGTLVWYPDLDSALDAVSSSQCDSGFMLTLYEDCAGDGLEGGDIEISSNVTLDLNGHTIESGIAVAEGGSLTVTDSVGGGEVIGSLSGTVGESISISLAGGIYHGDDALLYVADGYYAVCLGEGDDGLPIYAIYSEAEIGEHSAAYIETETACGETLRIYYESIAAALSAAAEGDTIVLSSDVVEEGVIYIGTDEYAISDVVIDLNGHTLDAAIEIYADAGYADGTQTGGTLKIIDGSGDIEGSTATGLITGTITVIGVSSDADENSNAYAETLFVPESAVSADLNVVLDGLYSGVAESQASYSFGAIYDEETQSVVGYGIVVGHTCVFNIPDFYIDENGDLSCTLRCSCGEYCMADGSPESFVVPKCSYSVIVGDDGTVTYDVDSFTVTGKSGGAMYSVYGGQLTIEPAAEINTYDSNGNLTGTVYLDAEGLENLNGILAGLAADEGVAAVEIVLWTDVDAEIELGGGAYTIDLNGNSLYGTLTVGDGNPSDGNKDTCLTITDSASSAEGGTLDGTGSAVNSVIYIDCDADLHITGGTFDDAYSSYAETPEGAVVVFGDDGTFTIVSEDIAKGCAVAVILDADGDVAGYYESVSAALSAASGGDTIKLINDAAEDVVLSEDVSVTIDLGGKTLTGDVSVTVGSLSIVDSADGDKTGKVTGTVSGEAEISGGSYTYDVGEYLADGYALYASYDDEGELVYTVISYDEGTGIECNAPDGALVAITYEKEDGGEATTYTVYFDDLDAALAALEDGCTVTILSDLGEEGDPIYIVIESGGDLDVTIDLSGHTVYGDVEANDNTSLTIADSSENESGEVIGSVYGDGDILVTGGTYTANVSDYLGEGGVMYVSAAGGKVTYKVLSGDDLSGDEFAETISGAVISVAYENEKGETVTVYYDSVEEAVSDLRDGSVVTLLGDVGEEDAENVLTLLTESDTEIYVTLDLNGHEISGDVVAGDNVRLTIVDGSESKEGSITGGVSTDGGGSVTIEGGTYGEDVSEYVDVKGDYVIFVTSEEGDTSYSMVAADSINDTGDGAHAAAASVTYTDADGKNITLYFETIEDAAAYASGKSADEGVTDVTITLLSDTSAECGLEIGGNVTLDLNGKSLEVGGCRGIVVAEGASLSVVGDGLVDGEIDVSGDLVVYAGAYSCDISEYVADGFVALCDEGGYYEVVTEKEALSRADVKVVSADGTVTYYENFADALDDLTDGDTLILLKDVSLGGDGGDANDVVIENANVAIDLNGNELDADVVVSGSGSSLTITDSVGGGSLTGTASEDSCGTLIVTGGTFSSDMAGSIDNFLPSGDDGDAYVVVYDGDGYTVVKKDEVGLVAEAVVVDSKGNESYYASIADAVAAAENTDGATITLLSDVEAAMIEIHGSVTIDLSGFTLDAQITIYADAAAGDGQTAGSLRVVDTGEASGSLTGTVSVVGELGYASDDDPNPYENSFVMEGVRPGADLTVDISSLGDGQSVYSFGEILTEEGESDEPAKYGIGREHVHNYNIEVWTVGADGTITLSYVCACGDYLVDEYGAIVVYDANVTITYNEENGTYEFYAVVDLPDGGQAECTVEKTVVAIVEADGVTYYAETLEEAAEIASRADSAAVTLVADSEEDVTFGGEVTLDLNGHDIYGTVAVADNAYLVVEGEGYVDALEVGDGSIVKLRGGTYGEESRDVVRDNTDYSSGYTSHVNSDGTATVMDAEEAAVGAAASVTDENGVTTYYEDLAAAIENLTDGCLLTLYDDVDINATIEITAGGVTIDLNDHDVYGNIEIAGGASAAICGDGYVDTVKVEEGASLTLSGGTYDDEETLRGHMDAECSVLVNADGTYTVVDGKKADEYSTVSAVVHVSVEDGEDYDVYFESVQSAVDFASECGAAVVELAKDYGGNVTVESGDVVIDLAGHELSGDVNVSSGACVEITDGIGGGFVEGALNVEGDASLTATGGTYADAAVYDYVDEDVYAVVKNAADGNGEVTYSVVPLDEVEGSAAAYVVYEDADGGIVREYYESIGDALAVALRDGYTLVLLTDAEIGGIVDAALSIDLNGHTLDLDIEIVATDESGDTLGMLTIGDSSDDGSGNGTGAITGKVTVTDSGSEATYDAYSDAFVLTGVVPGADFETDFSGLYAGEEEELLLGMRDDGNYGIVEASTHECVYDIEIWIFNADGTVTLKFMCVCGNYLTVTGYDGVETEVEYSVDPSDVEIFENGDGTVTIVVNTTIDGVGYSTEKTEAVAAYVEYTTGDGETVERYFESFEDALAFALENGGTLVLNDDVDFADVGMGADMDLVIDLNGHDMTCSVTVPEGSALTFVDSSADKSGSVYADLDIDGTLVLDGVSFALTQSCDEDMEGGIIIGDGTAVDLGGNTLSNVLGIGDDVTLEGGSGSTLILGADVVAGGALNVDGDITFDLNGAAYEGDIVVEDGASLTVADSYGAGSGSIVGCVDVLPGGGLDIYEGTYLGEDLVVTIGDDYILQALTDEYGDTYYEVVSEADHAAQGHGYDNLSSYSFDASDCTLTLTFTCFCGAEVTRVVYVSSDEYTTEVTDEGVVVRFTKSSTITAENGSSYSYEVDDFVIIEMYLEGEDGAGYIRSTYVSATCTTTGIDTYTYGYGDGVVVEVVTPITHTYPVECETANGFTYYYCAACGKFVTDVHSEIGYATEADLLEDVGYGDEFSRAKDAALEALEEAFEEILSSLDPDMAGYEAIVEAVTDTCDALRDEILSLEYEAQIDADATEREAYYAVLEKALEEAAANAQIELQKKASAEMLGSAFEEAYASMKESGLYGDDALYALGVDFGSLLVDFESDEYSSVDDVLDAYAKYLELLSELVASAKTEPDANSGSKTGTLYTSDDADVSGSVVSSSGISGGIELVITEMGIEGYEYDEGADLVHAGDGVYTYDELKEMVDGKSVVAVYDVSFVDISTSSRVYVFEGTYVVRIALSDELLTYEGLQIVYVGADGVVEVYDTIVTDDGYLEFVTTHFSTFMVLAFEKVTDLNPLIDAFFIFDCVLAAVAIVLAIVLAARWRKKKKEAAGEAARTNGTKQYKTLGSFGAIALLAVIPSGGVLISAMLGIIGLALLALDIYLLYCVLEKTTNSAYVTGDVKTARARYASEANAAGSGASEANAADSKASGVSDKTVRLSAGSEVSGEVTFAGMYAPTDSESDPFGDIELLADVENSFETERNFFADDAADAAVVAGASGSETDGSISQTGRDSSEKSKKRGDAEKSANGKPSANDKASAKSEKNKKNK